MQITDTGMHKTLAVVWDWSERHDVPVELARDVDSDWCLWLTFRDGRGLFRRSMPLPQRRERGTRRVTDDEWEAKVRKLMAENCQQARASRLGG